MSKDKKAEELALRATFHDFDQAMYRCRQDLHRDFGGDWEFSEEELRNFFVKFVSGR